MHGQVDEASLLDIAEKVRDEVSELPNITQTRLGKKPREISIEISENTLQKYGISFDYVSNKIRTSSMDVPGGCLLYTSPSPRDGLLSRMPSSA